MDLDFTFPAVSDLRRRARQRLPHFAFEYLDSSTGQELGARRTRKALDALGFEPAILGGRYQPALSTTFLGRPYALPVGMAPIGMSGMIWPRAEVLLSAKAHQHNLPFSLSTVSATTPEAVSANLEGNGWFQLYAPADFDVLEDMLKRVKQAGFTALALTVDVPGESRRERQRRAHLATPPQFTPRVMASVLASPGWALRMARAGMPRMPFTESYIPRSQARSSSDRFVHAGRLIRGYPDWDYLRRLRDLWQGPLMVKGVQDPADVKPLLDAGTDVLWVSNHSSRQFEAGPAPISRLPAIRAEAGADVPLIYDSGVQSGLDVLRALASGADFVMLGRAWHYALGALGAKGVDHLVHILRADMTANMLQIGARSLEDLADKLIEVDPL